MLQEKKLTPLQLVEKDQFKVYLDKCDSFSASDWVTFDFYYEKTQEQLRKNNKMNLGEVHKLWAPIKDKDYQIKNWDPKKYGIAIKKWIDINPFFISTEDKKALTDKSFMHMQYFYENQYNNVINFHFLSEIRKTKRLDKAYADRAQKIMLAKDMGNKTEELKKLEIEESEDKVELENLNNELSKNPEGRAIRQFLYNYSDENLNVETAERFVKQQTELRADDAKQLEAWIMKDHVQLDNGLQILTSSANKETVDKLNLFIIYINSVKDGFIDHEKNINYFNDLTSEISNSLFNK